MKSASTAVPSAHLVDQSTATVSIFVLKSQSGTLVRIPERGVIKTRIEDYRHNFMRRRHQLEGFV